MHNREGAQDLNTMRAYLSGSISISGMRTRTLRQDRQERGRSAERREAFTLSIVSSFYFSAINTEHRMLPNLVYRRRADLQHLLWLRDAVLLLVSNIFLSSTCRSLPRLTFVFGCLGPRSFIELLLLLSSRVLRNYVSNVTCVRNHQ